MSSYTAWVAAQPLVGLLITRFIEYRPQDLARLQYEDTMRFEQKLDDFIAAEMQRKHIPGLSLAVVKDGSTVIEKSYGFANMEHHMPATSDTVYEIASMTKLFTAAAILLLAEKGLIGVDDPLNRYHTGLQDAWNAITLRHLLSHTSGIPNWTLDWDRSDITPDIVSQAIFGSTLQFPPGDQYDYADTNYNLLGMVIHQVTGAPYDAFLREHIFTPLGMTATQHNDVRAIVPNRASGYDWRNDTLVNAYRIEWNNINISARVPANGANGSLLSTLTDILKWDAALSTSGILSQSVLAQMWTQVILTNGISAPAGYGCEIEDYHGHKLIASNGGIPGFTSSLSRFISDHLTIIILTNQDSKPWDMCQAVAGLYKPAIAR